MLMTVLLTQLFYWRRNDTNVGSLYSGFDLGTDHAKFDEIITRGITSTSMTVQVVGLNQLY